MVAIRTHRLGRAGGCSPARAALISPKSQGSPRAARPTITPSQPVALIMARASAALAMSPLPITGTATAAFTAAMMFTSTVPGAYICSRVRPWTTMAAAPAAAQAFAVSTAVTCSASQPARIFTVTGLPPLFFTTASTTRPQRSGSSSRRLPAPEEVILGAGQPMLMSMKSNWYFRMRPAASPMVSGSAPNSCTP